MVPSALRQGFLPTNRGLEVRLGAEGGGRSEGGVQAEVSAVKEGGEFGEAESEAFGGGGTKSDVAEFAAGTGGLAVEMEMGVGDSEDFGGFGEVTDKIEHGAVSCGARGAEREAENGAEMVFELAGDGAFDGPVAGIVDTRSHFVGEKLALVFEEFESEDAGVFHGFEDAVSGSFRGALDFCIEARGGR